MKAVFTATAILLSLVLLTAYSCCDKILENGDSPEVFLTVIYKDSSGQETTQSLHNPTTGHGYDAYIPASADYSLFYGAKDSGCIQSLILEKRAGKMDEHKTWIDPDFQEISRFTGNTDCPKKSPTQTYDMAAHQERFIVYQCTAKDFAGHQGGVTVWIIPQ